jgi:hypothetical protein
MPADTAARRQQNGSEPQNSHDLDVISAAIFAHTGAPPMHGMVHALLAQQPRQPYDMDVTLPLSGGHKLWLQYNGFTISSSGFAKS